VTRKIFLVLIAFALVLAGFWFGHARKKDPEPPVILKEVQTLGELVTVKYVMEKVVTHEIEKTFGKDRVLLIAQGVVKAGIDLRKMTNEDIRIGADSVSFHLPRSEVTDKYLVEKETFVYDRRTGFFIHPEKNLEAEARRIALGAMLASAHANGIHKDADDRAKALITKLGQQLGFKTVEFH